MKALKILPLAVCLAVFGCVELSLEQQAALDIPAHLRVPPKGSAPLPVSAQGTDPAILNALFELLEKSDQLRPDTATIQASSFNDFLSVGSPSGFELRNRTLNPAVALAQALAAESDPATRDRLVELARWERSMEVRATALIALARLGDIQDERTLHEAMAHVNPIVRFGAMEALENWGHPEKAVPLLRLAVENDLQPLLRVYAAGALARLGDDLGLSMLRRLLDSPDWLARAMAARALGDYGVPNDYELLLSRIDREGANEFVSAEIAVAALKLFGKGKG